MRSTRLPGKMLADVAGKPLVAWSASAGARAGAAVVIATDHRDIEPRCAPRLRVVLTSPSHPSGTDRIAEPCARSRSPRRDRVNVQGDEPLIDRGSVREVARALAARPALPSRPRRTRSATARASSTRTW
jgi:3-deoxy-manno-octulosonate cytidylyltransferase (CMP-KDO synthetase)